MKADWDKLGKAYANSETVMIVDVDCTAEGKSTCGSQGVSGYPTIKYYKEGKAKAYQGGRDFNSLKSFVEKTLNTGPRCNAHTLKGCKGPEQKFIEKHSGKSAEELKEVLAEKMAAKKEIKAERKAAKKELREKEKGWRKKEKLLDAAASILKQLQKGPK
jgi:hypothetical protein